MSMARADVSAALLEAQQHLAHVQACNILQNAPPLRCATAPLESPHLLWKNSGPSPIPPLAQLVAEYRRAHLPNKNMLLP